MAAPKKARTVPRPATSTPDRIIAAAGQLIDDVGIDNVNVAEIADYAGIHRVTVYRHFADRESILEEVLLRRSRPVLDRAAARLAKADRFPGDLAYVLVAAVDEARQIPGVLQAMALVQEGDSFKSPAMSDRFRAASQDVVRPYLLWAQEQGKMRADLSVDETVRWLTQVCYSWLYLAEDDSPAKLLEVCKTYVMPALVANQGR